MATSDLEARVARLERAVSNGVGVSLAEFDDPDQAAARRKQAEQASADGDKAAAKPAKGEEA